jgi:hypothetical protein
MFQGRALEWLEIALPGILRRAVVELERSWSEVERLAERLENEEVLRL